MNTFRTINGTYGSGNTPCLVHIMDTRRGSYYAVDGSINVNMCDTDALVDGVDVETVEDWDAFTWGEPVTDPEDLDDDDD